MLAEISGLQLANVRILNISRILCTFMLIIVVSFFFYFILTFG